jgi:hypothetical protein
VTTGISVFRAGETRPENLEEWLPTTGEVDLARQHQERIERADAARMRAATWDRVGISGLVGGLALDALAQTKSRDLGLGLGVVGLVVGLVGFWQADYVRGTNLSRHETEARRWLLIPGEDDFTAAARAVNELDGQRREQCGSFAKGD